MYPKIKYYVFNLFGFLIRVLHVSQDTFIYVPFISPWKYYIPLYFTFKSRPQSTTDPESPPTLSPPLLVQRGLDKTFQKSPPQGLGRVLVTSFRLLYNHQSLDPGIVFQMSDRLLTSGYFPHPEVPLSSDPTHPVSQQVGSTSQEFSYRLKTSVGVSGSRLCTENSRDTSNVCRYLPSRVVCETRPIYK